MEDLNTDLTSLINSYQNDVKHIKGSTEKEVFSNFYSNVNLNAILQWINKLFIKTSIKNIEESAKLQKLASIELTTKNYMKCLELLTKSLIFSPFNNENYSDLLETRSDVLFNLGKYEDCVNDIILHGSLKNNENIKYQLIIRLSNCYLKLNLFDKVQQCLDDLKKYLDTFGVDLEKNVQELINNQITTINKEITNNDNKNIKIDNIPKLLNKNNNFVSASDLITLKYNDKKGRHVIAAKDIKLGDILFIEKPFAFVPVWKENSNDFPYFCYNCFQSTFAPVPCKNCTETFCSMKCQEESWTKYHRFECIGSCIEIWTKIGVNFLAFRMFLLGIQETSEEKIEDNKKNIEIFQDKYNNYLRILSLVTNIDKMSKNDILPHLVSSLAISLYLKEKTDFFTYIKHKSDQFKSKTDDDVIITIGSTVLQHILQVISNASTIENVKEEFYDKFDSEEQIYENYIQTSGVGIFPSVAMMNHSCETNVTNYFINDCIVVKANCDIVSGGEIFNSYGYDCRKLITEERQINLKKQYFFDCDCNACKFPSKPEIFHEGLLCQKCNGCSLSTSEENYRCTNCEHEFNATNHFIYIRKAEDCFKKYESSKNVENLKKSLILREKVFYKYNYSIYTTTTDLQTFYGAHEDFELWWYYREKSLELEKYILGDNTLRYAMNLRLTLLILLRYLSGITKIDVYDQNFDDMKMLKYAEITNAMFENCQNVFKLFYPEEKLHFNVIKQLLNDFNNYTAMLLKIQCIKHDMENKINF